MCHFASGILTKTSVLYCDKNDSHTAILEEYKIDDSTLTPDFVEFELIPPNDGDWDDFEAWEFKVDQDYLPRWYNPVQDALRARMMLPQRFPEGFKKGLSVEGSLYLGELTRLPQNAKLSAGGYIFLNGLTSLPDNVKLSAGGSIHLVGLTSLPDGIKLSAGGNLFLSNLTSLPNNAEISAYAYLYLSKALEGKDLPTGTEIKAKDILYV